MTTNTTTTKHYFAALEGKTIKQVTTLAEADMSVLAWDHYGVDETTVLIFTDGTVAILTADPEGNGPGWMDLGEIA